MADSKYQLTNITVDHENQRMEADWADGHHSIYPLDGLRRACPCVHCQGGHAQMGKPVDPNIFKEAPRQKWKITDVKVVGSYAIQIFWFDGHNSGIYKFERLRDMCPVENGVIRGE